MALKGAKGAFTPEEIQTFADLAVRATDSKDTSKMHFQVDCAASEDFNFAYIAGVTGIGYAHAKNKAPILMAMIANPDDYNQLLGGDRKDEVVRSLFWIGARESAPALAKMFPSGNSVLTFRQRTLAALTAWNARDAVDACKRTFTEQTENATREACGLYLAKLGIKDAAPLALRNIEELRNHGDTILALFGDVAGRQHLESQLDSKGRGQLSTHIALAHLGRAESLAEVKREFSEGNSNTLMRASLLFNYPKSSKLATELIPVLKTACQSARGEAKAHVLVARAMFGDATAIAELVSGLSSPDAELRGGIVNASGANFGSGSYSAGLVANKELVKALVAYAEAEPDETRKAAATIAIMNIRAITE